jgi:hypothetical protein
MKFGSPEDCNHLAVPNRIDVVCKEAFHVTRHALTFHLSGNISELYSGDIRLESLSGHRLS